MAGLIVTVPATLTGRTWGEILDYLESRFDFPGDSEFRIRATSVLRDVIMDFASRCEWKWLQQTSELTTEVGLGEYALIADADQIIGPLYPQSHFGPIDERPLSFVRRMQAESFTGVTGHPQYFARLNDDCITMWPTPSSVVTMQYDYTVTVVNDIVESAIPPVPFKMIYVLIAGAEEKLHADDNRFDKALQFIGARYENMIATWMFRDELGEHNQFNPEDGPRPGLRQWVTD